MAINAVTLFSIGVGGFLGANARYLMSTWIANRTVNWNHVGAFPFATLLINVIGSFLLAVFGVWVLGRVNVSENTRLMIATGFLGAFTTFSTFANESIGLLRSGDLSLAIVYIILTNVLCLVGVVLGLWTVNRFLP